MFIKDAQPVMDAEGNVGVKNMLPCIGRQLPSGCIFATVFLAFTVMGSMAALSYGAWQDFNDVLSSDFDSTFIENYNAANETQHTTVEQILSESPGEMDNYDKDFQIFKSNILNSPPQLLQRAQQAFTSRNALSCMSGGGAVGMFLGSLTLYFHRGCATTLSGYVVKNSKIKKKEMTVVKRESNSTSDSEIKWGLNLVSHIGVVKLLFCFLMLFIGVGIATFTGLIDVQKSALVMGIMGSVLLVSTLTYSFVLLCPRFDPKNYKVRTKKVSTEVLKQRYDLSELDAMDVIGDAADTYIKIKVLEAVSGSGGQDCCGKSACCDTDGCEGCDDGCDDDCDGGDCDADCDGDCRRRRLSSRVLRKLLVSA